MRVTPRLLRRLAVWVVSAPAIAAFLGQVGIWLIPGCNPNPYSLGECMVAGVNVAGALLGVVLGGLVLSVALFFIGAVPLFLAAWFLSVWLRRRHHAV